MNSFLLRSDCCHCAWLVISKNWFPYVPSLDPFWWLYLRHVSGIFGLRWCRSVFTSCVWAQEQPSHHSSLVTSSFKSVLKACRILFEDSLHLLTNRLYNKDTRPLASECFKVMSYRVDRWWGVSYKPLHCLPPNDKLHNCIWEGVVISWFDLVSREGDINAQGSVSQFWYLEG